jgi:hypothetical protein
MAQLGTAPAGFRDRMLADGWPIRCPFHEVVLEWDNGPGLTEVLALQGRPLLGTALLQDYLFQSEMTEGGEVWADRL